MRFKGSRKLKVTDLFVCFYSRQFSSSAKSVHGLEIYHLGEASDPRRALEVAARENGMKLESNSAPPWQFIIADNPTTTKITKNPMDFCMRSRMK